MIDITTMYGAKFHQPRVVLRWGKEEGELTVAEARAHALRILEAAEAAESDAFIADWIRKTHEEKSHDDLTPEQVEQAVVVVLRDFRNARIVRAEKEGAVV